MPALNQPFLSDGGEMGTLMRSMQWCKTPMGDPAQWPKSLQTMLGVILHSKFPMFIWWGPDLICFYNDAYRPSLGNEGKHPSILGKPAKEAWPEIWETIAPLIRQVLDGGEATWSEDQLLPIYRNGKIEDVYWTFSYSRINNDDGRPYGVLVTCMEMTQKVVNQRRLQESNDLLKFATEAADLGTWDYNPATGKFVANDRLKKWFGLGPDDEADLEIALRAISEKDRERVAAAIAASLDFNKQEPYDIEYTIVHRQTGKETVVLVRGRPFFENGIGHRFSGTMEDITYKNKTRQALAESEQNLRSLIEQSPVAMCVLKGPVHIVDIVNEQMIRLWGKSKDQVMHRPMFEGLPEAKGQGLEELLDRVFLTGERFTAQERPVNLPRENGIETVYQNFVYEPFRASDGTIEGVIAVTIDVTEQVLARHLVEEAEERARLATEAAQLGTFDFNIKQKTSITSARFFEIFDISPDASHPELVQRIHPEDRIIRERAHTEALVSGRLFYEARIVRQDLRITWVRIEGKVIIDNQGQPYRIVGTALDFTEKRGWEEKREEYMAIASHELRNPLTSLKLSLELLSDLIEDRSQRSLLDKSKQQVQRLITMTGELLNVSKISAGVLDLKPEVINIRECITESISTVKAGSGSNEFIVTGTPDINLRADKFRIEQVMINLLSNASKYSPRGTLIMINVDSTPAFVKIRVIDKGIGLDATEITHVFKKFGRLEASKSIEGHGLGLYISEQIIHSHQGEIGVESEKGIGSVFWFTLPR